MEAYDAPHGQQMTDDELDMLLAGARTFHEARHDAAVDCPLTPRIRQLAAGTSLPDDAARAHLFSCPSCFAAYRQGVAAGATRGADVASAKFVRGSWRSWLTLAAAMIVALFVYHHRDEWRDQGSGTRDRGRTHEQPAQPQMIQVTFGSAQRGESDAAVAASSPLPRGRVTIYGRVPFEVGSGPRRLVVQDATGALLSNLGVVELVRGRFSMTIDTALLPSGVAYLVLSGDDRDPPWYAEVEFEDSTHQPSPR